MNSIFELWSELQPERALACSFNLEYLLVGGRDARHESRPIFMWYDWMVGGWGGRNGKDGSNATAPIFGVGLAVQPLEAQERLCPVLTTGHEIRHRLRRARHASAAAAASRRARILREAEGDGHVLLCDRARSITWGIEGGLPSIPHGVWLTRDGEERFLGAVFSNVPCGAGDRFTRPSAGGGGFGDPLERDPAAVGEDVADGYVSIERARKDYGVVVREVDAELAEYEVDDEATERERERIRGRAARLARGGPEAVAERYRGGRARPARPHPPLRRDPRLGHRRAAPEDDRAVPGDAPAADGRPLGAGLMAVEPDAPPFADVIGSADELADAVRPAGRSCRQQDHRPPRRALPRLHRPLAVRARGDGGQARQLRRVARRAVRRDSCRCSTSSGSRSRTRRETASSDSLRNVVAGRRAGLLFLIPGMEETLRVNGRAWLTRDPEAAGAARSRSEAAQGRDRSRGRGGVPALRKGLQAVGPVAAGRLARPGRAGLGGADLARPHGAGHDDPGRPGVRRRRLREQPHLAIGLRPRRRSGRAASWSCRCCALGGRCRRRARTPDPRRPRAERSRRRTRTRSAPART